MTRNIASRYSRASGIGLKRKREKLQRNARRWGKSLNIFWREFRIWLAVLLALLAITGIVILLFSPVFNVKQIQIRRQDPRVDIEDIQKTLAPLFKQRLLFVSRNQILELLGDRFPDVRRVEIEKTYPSTLAVSLYLDPVIAELDIDDAVAAVTPDVMVIGGTGTGAAATASGSYAYITAKGYTVFSPIKLSREKLPVLRLTDWGVRPENRSRAVSPELLKAVFDARTVLQTDFGLSVSGITIYLRAQEFHIRLERVSLWFDLSNPLDVQFQRFREFLRSQPLDQVKEYIDLRISDRVIYK